MTDLRDAEIDQQWQLLTHTGPGTPGGNLIRRYWQPVSLSQDLPAGGAPQQVRILGEDLVLFRDEQGRPGLLGRKCAHRCADLSYGRIENGGLRCVYHGWLYDVNGKCLEQPAEPEGGRGRHQIQQLSYPCVEKGGAVWTYMGPAPVPLFPEYPTLTAPDAYRFVTRWVSNCNYLQGNEGNIDPVHTSYLHKIDLDKAGAFGDSIAVFSVDNAPKLSVKTTRFGVRVFTDRKAGPGKKILRVTNFVMPNACAIGGYETGLGRGGTSMFWHVPIDDTHHYRYEFTFHSKARLPLEDMHKYYNSEKIEGDKIRRGPENRYLQNRDEMNVTYLGMGQVFPVHDLFVTESQGDIHNHNNEHLATSDIAIVRARREIAEAIRDVQAGKDPRGVVRKPEDNDFRDLLVLTEPLDESVDNDDFVAMLEKQNIYELNPAVMQQAAE
jgi:phenylpropionate dioxygenase-like ring-hydroxylating dioxygenase large terminal subunit